MKKKRLLEKEHSCKVQARDAYLEQCMACSILQCVLCLTNLSYCGVIKGWGSFGADPRKAMRRIITSYSKDC